MSSVFQRLVPESRCSPEARVELRALRAHMPQVRPARWLRTEPLIQTSGTAIAVSDTYMTTDGLRALVSLDESEMRGVRWLHVSVSREDSIPSWQDMADAKEALMGDAMAIQMHPPRAEYVNRHPNVLHLWHNVLGPTVPDEGCVRMAEAALAGRGDE